MSGPRSRRDAISPYITRDGSEIRELMHPAVHGNRRQSLAEAIIAPGQASALHRHQQTKSCTTSPSATA